MNGDFYNWGLPVGSVSGIRIRIHWILLFFWFWELNDLWGDEGIDRGTAIALWAFGAALLFVIILLHELGHCYAARRVGGDAREVLLWPLGGLAFVDAPYLPRPQLIVAAGGPLVNVLIAAVVFPVTFFLESRFPGIETSSYFRYARYMLITWNLIILIFNLIPLYPLDGGRIFHAALWGHLARRYGMGREAHYRATMATVWASRITAGAGILWGLFEGSLRLVIIFAWAWMSAETLARSVREGMGSDFSFGYDFSRGYTSLGEPQRPRKRGGGFLRRLLSREPRPMTDHDRRRLDELLEKISREGMGSLTRGERRFLEKMSRRRR